MEFIAISCPECFAAIIVWKRYCGALEFLGSFACSAGRANVMPRRGAAPPDAAPAEKKRRGRAPKVWSQLHARKRTSNACACSALFPESTI